MDGFHPLVKQVLDGELTPGELPTELRAEGEGALRLLEAVDRTPLTLSPDVEHRVMAAVRRRAASPWQRGWRWLGQPRDLHVRVRPWVLGALAAAAALAILVVRPQNSAVTPPVGVAVRFVLYAPDAQQVAIAGTFNQWDQMATPLVRTSHPGVWTATLTLPAGQHQYAFVVDGVRWVLDPDAPAVDDGFGRRNSVVAVAAQGGRAGAVRMLAATIFVATLGATPLAAVQDVGTRLAGRVSPDVAAFVRDLAAQATARGLPVDPLVQKAIEGAAKGVPAGRVMVAVSGVVAQLDTAATALRAAGVPGADTEAIAAGGFALNAGLKATEVSQLAHAGATAYGAAVTLRVAGTLAALGVPGGAAVDLVNEMIRSGSPPGELFSLPAQVQSAIGRGATPAQAAAGLARAAAARGRSSSQQGGPPPWARKPPSRKP